MSIKRNGYLWKNQGFTMTHFIGGLFTGGESPNQSACLRYLTWPSSEAKNTAINERCFLLSECRRLLGITR